MKRESKIDCAWTIVGGIAAVIACSLIYGCAAAAAPIDGAKYSVNLEECNRLATNVCQSIACENVYRAAIKHEPRIIPKHCTQDGGLE